MVTIDLTTPPPPARQLPRRAAPPGGAHAPRAAAVAELAGGAPLPFDLAEAAGPACPRGPPRPVPRHRRGHGVRRRAGLAARPGDSLRRRGLLTDAGIDAGLAGAIGLLATPHARARPRRGRRRHARSRPGTGRPATRSPRWPPSTASSSSWRGSPPTSGPASSPGSPSIPEDVDLSESAVPAHVDLPFELVDATGEALRAGRSDLVPVLMSQHGEGIVDGDAEPARRHGRRHRRGRRPHRGPRPPAGAGRQVSDAATTVVGVVSWVLLADGWHALRPHHGGRRPTASSVRRVDPADLAHRARARPRRGDRMSDAEPHPSTATRRRAAACRRRGRRRQVRPDAAAGRPLRRVRRRDARPRPPRRRRPRRRRRRRVRRAVAGDLRPGRGRHPRRHHRQARAADPLGRARRRRAGGPRHRADLPLDRRAPGRPPTRRSAPSPAAPSATSHPRSRSAARSSRPA